MGVTLLYPIAVDIPLYPSCIRCTGTTPPACIRCLLANTVVSNIVALLKIRGTMPKIKGWVPGQ